MCPVLRLYIALLITADDVNVHGMLILCSTIVLQQCVASDLELSVLLGEYPGKRDCIDRGVEYGLINQGPAKSGKKLFTGPKMKK